MSPEPPDTTRLLNRYGRGERAVEPELLDSIYTQLHALAQSNMRGQSPDHTLQATALVNEAWMRIQRQNELEFDGRAQFFALASRVMRSVLVDHSRSAQRRKRGEGQPLLSLDDAELGPAVKSGISAVEVLALEDALERLERADADLCRLVELRFFGGLSHREIAEVQQVSVRTVERQWRAARAFLNAELAG